MARIRAMVLGLLACIALCVTSALAQPAVFQNLGFLERGTILAPLPLTQTPALGGGVIKWYKFSLIQSANATDYRFLDIYTSRVFGSNVFDTEIGLYSINGVLLGNDDNDGAGGFSALSFGVASPTRPANGADFDFNGRDGANVLPAGDYWLAVGVYNVTFGTNNWYAVSTITATGSANVVLAFGADLPNDTCFTATTLPNGSSTTTGNNSAATSTGETVICTPITKGVWFNFTAGIAGTYEFNTQGSGQDSTVLALFNACGGFQLACTAGSPSRITYPLAAGQNVKILLGSPDLFFTLGGPYTLNVVAPTSPTGVGSATPSTVINTGAGTTNLRVTVTPGQFPLRANHIVTVNAAAINAGSVILRDDGVAPDAVAGDNIFNRTVTVASGTTVGALSLPFGITSSDSRTNSGTIALTIREASGACCVGGVATIRTASACATAGGTFNGDGSSIVGSGTLFTSANTFPIAIPYTLPPTPAVSTIVIASAATITSGLNVRLGLLHTWVGDLTATLSNGATSVILIGRPGVTASNTEGFNSDLAGVYNFSDLAPRSITNAAPVLPAGDYLPTGTGVRRISSFNGSPAAGTWTITITDSATADAGTLTSFSIEVNPIGCAPTVPPASPTSPVAPPVTRTAPSTAATL